jgi:hypothetical protein
MRELSRFRGEFLDNYSLRSKLLMTLGVQQEIQNLMVTQSNILNDEQRAVDHFVQSSQELFDSKLINFIQNIRSLRTQKDLTVQQNKAWKFSKMHLKALSRQMAYADKMREFQASATLFRKDPAMLGIVSPASGASEGRPNQMFGTRTSVSFEQEYPVKPRNTRRSGQLYRLINGVKCFVKYEHNTEVRSCTFTVYSKIYSKEMLYKVTNTKKGFNPRAAVRKLRILFDADKAPYVTTYGAIDEVYVDQFADTLYFMLPSHFISYVYGGNENAVKLVIYKV